jgi:hypothetical protein
MCCPTVLVFMLIYFNCLARPHVDFSLFYDGLGSGEVLVSLELYLLASFLLVFPLFKVRQCCSVFGYCDLRLLSFGKYSTLPMS